MPANPALSTMFLGVTAGKMIGWPILPALREGWDKQNARGRAWGVEA
jgi:hypothetical protein